MNGSYKQFLGCLGTLLVDSILHFYFYTLDVRSASSSASSHVTDVSRTVEPRPAILIERASRES